MEWDIDDLETYTEENLHEFDALDDMDDAHHV